MKAVVLRGVNDLRIEDLPDPRPKPDEALVKIRLSGVCGTDVLIVLRIDAGFFDERILTLCDELGVAAYWDCVKLNLGSFKIARKLGFRNERSYKILAWFPPNREVGIK